MVGVGPVTEQVEKGNDRNGGCGLAASMWVITLLYLLSNRIHPYPVTHLPIGSGYFRAKPSPVWIPQQFSNLVILYLLAYEDGTERVFRNVGI